jgi:uncharacterized protein YndB with AHSA1/START domain
MTNPVTLTAPERLPFIDIVRDFDAPVANVWRAHCEPDLVAQWLGPRGYEMIIDYWETRPRGGYRYVHRHPAGTEAAFHGVFHTVADEQRIIQTFEYEGTPGQVSIDTQDFEDLGDGRTRLRIHSVFPSVEARDAMIAAGMEHGIVEGDEKLDELLARL